MPEQHVDQFSELFAGNPNAWGAVHGEAVKEPLDRARWVWHLTQGSIGVYPLTPKEHVPPHERPRGFASDSLVRWGCTDIDNKADPESTLPLAKNIRTALAYMGMVSWIERTKGKGYHVWLFLDHWQRPAWVRNVLLLAHDAAGVAPVEVNPKQVALNATTNKLGNYVNLPYPWSRQPHKRVVICAEGKEMELGTFVEAAMATRVSAETIELWAGRYVAPQAPQRPNVDITPTASLQAILERLKPLSRKIWEEGPLPDRDGKAGRGRYQTLQRLAFLMADQGGFTPSEMFAVLWSADERMADPKFHVRADGEEQVKLMVARALTPRSR